MSEHSTKTAGNGNGIVEAVLPGETVTARAAHASLKGHRKGLARLWPFLVAGLLGVPLGTALLEHVRVQPLKLGVTFWCYRCGGMASARTCPHADNDRLQVSGTQLRKWLSEGSAVPVEFSRAEVLEILRGYYAGL